MKKIISTRRIPIKMWLDELEPEAMRQSENLADLPFAYKHIALMPDAHPGYGMPIGAVLATKGVVVPNAVGVDIGCGMCATRTSLRELDKDQLKRILGQARKFIPLGFNWHKEPQDKALMPEVMDDMLIVRKQYQPALKQLGTLGGGNHFIEVQKGYDGFIWLMVHSGSRNIGNNVAKHYNKVALDLNNKYFSRVTAEKQLAFLPLDTAEAAAYLNEMHYCIDFALANRQLIIKRFFESVMLVAGDCEHGEIVNKAYN